MNDFYLLLPVTALLPLTAVLLVSRADPYQVLILRGVLGVVAALVYVLLGAADVALTEALVGTLLSTTLYAVALRSSMALRLSFPDRAPPSPQCQQLLRTWLEPAGLRLRLVPPAEAALAAADGCHGRLEADQRLVLVNPRLLKRLQALEGYRAWRDSGGALDLADTP